MTSRQRVLMAMDHKPVDRVPRVFKATPEVETLLVEELGLQAVDDLKARFCVENLHWPFYWFDLPDPRQRELPNGAKINRWGIRTIRADYGGGVYDEPVHARLADVASVADVESYDWPDPSELDFSVIGHQLEALHDKAVSGTNFCIYEIANQMRGYQTFLEDLLLEPKIVQAMSERIEAYWTDYNERVWNAASGCIQVFMSGDDFGTQQSLVMSKDLWKKFFRPAYKRAYAWAKKKGLRTMIHCDGAIKDIIPDLIEIGLDVLDPVQPMAAGMDPYNIKKEFGEDLCLHGTVDVQGLLPFGTPQRIKDEVKRQIEVLGEGSGFILGPSHCVQPGVPLENILAVYEAADEM